MCNKRKPSTGNSYLSDIQKDDDYNSKKNSVISKKSEFMQNKKTTSERMPEGLGGNNELDELV